MLTALHNYTLLFQAMQSIILLSMCYMAVAYQWNNKLRDIKVYYRATPSHTLVSGHPP